ncbi:glycosyltransferase family 4 protein [Stratiformator vulcanicus]|uniref:glycosyltransferase family 4 protein n=1 Tax=Stratiformator vulcanicus TaxID=2527980 RepID=UPI002877D121|nr:glycosyltransferase family 1 protein [Stratiformator vulcanicus]
MSAGASWTSLETPRLIADLKARHGFEVAQIIYDCIPTFMPQLWGPGFSGHFTAWLADMLHVCDHAIAISEKTAEDLRLFAQKVHLPSPRTSVIRLGDNISQRTVTAKPKFADALNDSFVLTVGTIEARKNHRILYQVWRKLSAELGEECPSLVCVGSPGFLTGELEYEIFNDPLTFDKIKFVHGVSDAELLWLYDNCRFTVYPSIYEGWGLPVGESLRHGRHCIATDNSSIPEIAGDLVDYFDPHDTQRCYELVRAYLLDNELLRHREQRIQDEYEITTWTECADQLLQLLVGTTAKSQEPSRNQTAVPVAA